MSIIPSASPNDTSPAGLTPERELEIRTLEQAATPGPWESDGAEIYGTLGGVLMLDLWVGETLDIDNQERSNADAAFIATAREAVPELLAEVADLRARVAELEALKPARFQDCQVCGAGYEYGQPCPSCEFKARMTAEPAPRDLRPGAEAARRTIRDRQTADSAPLARRLRRISPMEELARDLESVIAPLKGDARRGAELALNVIRTRAAAATIPTTEATS
ncbi:hypothetical protein ABTX84_19385 [Streptomyces sp. NPDC095614]|uniref:hypothetical protein n=1 Tax=Streptomyces sp. NPDC095614 TaxID=3156692 RepID=UPI003324431F